MSSEVLLLEESEHFEQERGQEITRFTRHGAQGGKARTQGPGPPQPTPVSDFCFAPKPQMMRPRLSSTTSFFNFSKASFAVSHCYLPICLFIPQLITLPFQGSFKVSEGHVLTVQLSGERPAAAERHQVLGPGVRQPHARAQGTGLRTRLLVPTHCFCRGEMSGGVTA